MNGNTIFESLDGIVDIIVLVKHQGIYSWFCSDKVYWIMDYATYASEFDENDTDYSERFDIGILDESTAIAFFRKMRIYEASLSELKKLFKNHLPLHSFDDAYHLFPKLFLDFDNRTLYSVYPELLRLENYAPSSWKAHYAEFYSLIPLEQRYWIINGDR